MTPVLRQNCVCSSVTGNPFFKGLQSQCVYVICLQVHMLALAVHLLNLLWCICALVSDKNTWSTSDDHFTISRVASRVGVAPTQDETC